MANNKNAVFYIDTSLFKGVVDEKDEFNPQATKIWENLLEEKAALITSNYVIDETLTLIRIRCGLAKAREFREKILTSNILKIIRVTASDEANAWEWFIKDWSDLSFTDCVSFAIMKRLGLEKVLTFDTHFSRAGFGIVK